MNHGDMINIEMPMVLVRCFSPFVWCYAAVWQPRLSCVAPVAMILNQRLNHLFFHCGSNPGTHNSLACCCQLQNGFTKDFLLQFHCCLGRQCCHTFEKVLGFHWLDNCRNPVADLHLQGLVSHPIFSLGIILNLNSS